MVCVLQKVVVFCVWLEQEWLIQSSKIAVSEWKHLDYCSGDLHILRCLRVRGNMTPLPKSRTFSPGWLHIKSLAFNNHTFTQKSHKKHHFHGDISYSLAYNTFSSMRNNVIQALTERRECYELYCYNGYLLHLGHNLAHT